MPLYRPSIFTALAAVIFFLLAVISVTDHQWREMIAWLLLGVGFALPFAPRTLFGKRTAVIAGGTAAVGAVLFILEVAEKLT